MAFIGNTNTTQAFTPAVDFFSGDASTTAFTLSRPVASVAQVQAVVNNVPQDPGSAYTVSSNTITFTSAPSSGTNNIYVYYTSPITQVIAPGQGTVGTTQLQNGLTVNFADGTAAAPSITNDGDTNTGIFFPAADTIGFAEGGAEVMRIDSSGNVGIGTSSPSSFYSEAQNLVVGTGTGGQGMTIYAGTASQSRIMFADGTTGSDPYTGFVQYDHSANALTFGTNGGTERMRIDASGNLQFNSGYGSVATAYACRAWVNFNGTGTVAIRASGNVSSITDNGTGDYTVNFTTAMVDANYSALTDGNYNINAGNYSDPNGTQIYRTYDASYFGIISRSSGSNYDFAWVTAAVFR